MNSSNTHLSSVSSSCETSHFPFQLSRSKASTPPSHSHTPNNRSNPGYNDFFWTYTEEPHRTRRHAIIQKYPEVTKLCGYEPLTKYLVVLVVALQLSCAFYLRNSTYSSLRLYLLAYFIGATANQNLFLAIHEISHNLAFKSIKANRYFAFIANLPIGVPYSASFRPYHLAHHKALGVDGIDTDLPTKLEAIFLDSVLGKAFFCTFQIFFYAIRPILVHQLPLGLLHLFNVLVQLSFNAIIVHVLGFMPLFYLLLSSFLAGSLHPCAGHFIAEHYVFNRAKVTLNALSMASNISPPSPSPSKSGSLGALEHVPIPETYSYYGSLNLLTYNVGYHNEHHDFPAIPWSRLPRLHQIANEFYRDLPHHNSWTSVIWCFIWDVEVGLWCRVKRASQIGPPIKQFTQ